jgi:hypothetical protein
MIKLNKSEQEIIDGINQLLDWYSDNASKSSIDMLLDFQDKLSLYSVNLSYMIGQSTQDYLGAYYNRKCTYFTKKLAFLKDGDKNYMAETKAEAQIRDERKTEADSQSITEGLNLQLRQVNMVLRTVAQRISYSKQEKDRLEKLSN